jgi:hypothetical protein
MIFVFAPTIRLPRMKKKISSQQFVHHAAETPDVCSLIVALPKDYFRRAVLSSLDLSREMVVLPAGIA